MILGRTRAVANKVLCDLDRLLYVTYIAVQAVFLLVYGFRIFCNFERPFYLVLYSILCAATLITLILHLAFKGKKRERAHARVVIRLAKYFANASLLIVVIVELVLFGGTEIDRILAGVSVSSLLLQLVLEILRVALKKYTDLLVTAWTMDVEPWIEAAEAVSNPASSFYSIVDKPLELVARSAEAEKEKKEMTDLEKQVNALATDYIRKEEAQKKEKRTARTNREKEKVRRHSKIIAKKAAGKAKEVAASAGAWLKKVTERREKQSVKSEEPQKMRKTKTSKPQENAAKALANPQEESNHTTP